MLRGFQDSIYILLYQHIQNSLNNISAISVKSVKGTRGYNCYKLKLGFRMRPSQLFIMMSKINIWKVDREDSGLHIKTVFLAIATSHVHVLYCK